MGAQAIHHNPSLNPTFCTQMSPLLCLLLGLVFVTSDKSGKKKGTKINFLGLETSGLDGRLPREGVGVEKFILSLEILSSLGFEGGNLGCAGNFAGVSGPFEGCSKSLRKKGSCSFLVPKQKATDCTNATFCVKIA